MAWNNAYYRITCLYLCTLVTLIFGFQMHRYFVADPVPPPPACPVEKSSMSRLPVVGVLFDG